MGLGCKLNLRMSQEMFSPNTHIFHLEELGCGVLLVCTGRVPINMEGNCVSSSTFQICYFIFLQEVVHGLPLNWSLVAS